METPASGIANLSGAIHLSIDGEMAAVFDRGKAEKAGDAKNWRPIFDPEEAGAHRKKPKNCPTSGSESLLPTRFPLASVTKSFTAALVWQRIAEGRLTPDTKIAAFVPFQRDPVYRPRPNPKKSPPPDDSELERFWNQVTIGQLLNHTSGLADHVGSSDWRAMYTADWTVDQIIGYVQHMAPKEADAAQNHDHYTNAGYTVLGRALESAALNDGLERRLETILQEDIFDVLDLKSTGVLETNALDACLFALPNRGATLNTTADLRVPPMFFASGDIYSTAEDLDSWAIGLLVHRCSQWDFEHKRREKQCILPEQIVTRLWSSPPTTPGGRTQGMTLLYSPNGYHVVYKTGHLPTYSNDLAYVPEYGITVSVLQNAETINSSTAPGPTQVSRATDAILNQTVKLIDRALAERRTQILP